MTLWEFREDISEKILTYKPTSRIYWGNGNSRMSVAQSSMQQKRGIPNKYNDDKNTINFNTFKRERHRRNKAGRLCGDMEMFHKHVLQR